MVMSMNFTFLNSSDPYNPYSTLDETQRNQLHKYTEYKNYYDGIMTQWLKQDISKDGVTVNDNVTLNLAKRIINKGNNLLFGKGLQWQLDNIGTSPEEEILDVVWGFTEERNSFLIELGLSGAIYGDVYVQILIEDNTVKLKSLNPSRVFVTTNEYDDEAVMFDIRWYKQKKHFRLLHWVNNKGTWSYQTEVWDRNKWVAFNEEQEWPYSWPFIIHAKNLPKPHSYYGMSDLEDIEINDTINQVASNLNKIIRIFAHPVVWGAGFSKSDLDTSAVLMSSNTDAKLQALELANNLGDAQQYLKILKGFVAEVTGIPESDPDVLNIGTKSGFALEVLLNDAVLKTGIKRNLYGKLLITINARLLDIFGFDSTTKTQLYWPDILPKDPQDVIAEDKFLLENKLVSKKTITTKRGYNYDAEQEQIREETVNPLQPLFTGE